MSEYTVSEISARSPDMSDSDFAAFVEDIRTNGQLVPIWVRGGEVIDGRKRLRACAALGIEPKVVNLNPDQDAEAVARALNVLRTHYTHAQRALYAARRANITVGQTGPGRESAGLIKPATSLEQAAREAGVHRSAVVKAKRIERDAAPEVVEAVERGRLTLHAASQIVDAVPKNEQPSAVEKVIEASKGLSRHTPVAPILTGQATPRRKPAVDIRIGRSNPNGAVEQFAIAIQKLEVVTESLSEHAQAASTDARRSEFAAALREARTTLTRVINALEIAA